MRMWLHLKEDTFDPPVTVQRWVENFPFVPGVGDSLHMGGDIYDVRQRYWEVEDDYVGITLEAVQFDFPMSRDHRIAALSEAGWVEYHVSGETES